MKKLVVMVLILGAGGAGGWYWWSSSQSKAAAPNQATTTAPVQRGRVELTVNTTGRVVSNLDVDIKCKASGTIIKLPFDISDQVEPGALLLELDPVDEQRNVARSEVTLSSSKARLAQAEKNLAVAKNNLRTDTDKALAAIDSAKAKAEDFRAKAERMKELLDKKLVSKEDAQTSETAAATAASDLKNAEVRLEELKTVEDSLELKRQDVELAKSQVKNDELNLADARQRLADTSVLAPIGAAASSQPSSSPSPSSRPSPGPSSGPAAGPSSRPAGRSSSRPSRSSSRPASTQPSDAATLWVVTALNVQKGTIISSGVTNVGGGTTVMTLSDLSRVFVVASVDESDIGKVKLDQDANITVDAFKGEKFAGTVKRIAPKGVNASNVVTFEVKMEVVSDNKAKLKPEMTANIQIVAANSTDDALYVPADAVVRKDKQRVVTVVLDSGQQEDRPVEVGVSNSQTMEITKGLEEGQVVLVRKDADSRWRGGQQQQQGGPPPAMRMMPRGGGR